MTNNSSRHTRGRPRDSHSFLVIEENRFAFAAAMQLRTAEASRPCRVVTITGPAGCGKSHLARQLLRDALLEDPRLIDTQMTAAEFSAEFTAAAEASCIPEFQQSLRRSHLFILEDLQTLDGRTESQQQLLAIIDDVVAQGGRVLLTANRPIGEIRGLMGKLVSRCHGGVCAEISLPSSASRTTLLSHFAVALQMPIPEEVLRLLARQLPLSPRELLGALVKLRTLAEGQRRRIDLETAQLVIREFSAADGPGLPEIVRLVAQEFLVTAAVMRSPGRVQSTVVARQTAMYLARHLSGQSLASIGEFFGGRNHATVLHACRRAAEQLESDAEYAQRVNRVRESLRSNGFRMREELVESPSALGE